MSMLGKFERRASRRGTGVLPPNPTRWEHEHNGLDLRDDLSLPIDRRLEHLAAFDLIKDVIGVIPHTALNLTQDVIKHFSGSRASRWSGMCVPCPEGHLVVFNAAHPETRVRATLMEEFFHLRLGHAPTVVRVSGGQGARDFNASTESEAYGSGAAALVPYKALKAMLGDGMSVTEIADHFHVSEQLVDFRMQVSKLVRRRKRA
ncbi:MAG: ImmA/IrrE family metallo-endopeptidase [Aquabacterium sp.]|nr:MAG: ImmA/IrrE family metallo-endopeptidase [Aquabacterium sp.]